MPCPPPGYLPNLGLLHCRHIFLLSEPPGQSKNTGVGGLSLLHAVFLIQESNWGLPHCRWILYQLSYQGSPLHVMWDLNSSTRNGIHTPALEGGVLTTGPPEKVLFPIEFIARCFTPYLPLQLHIVHPHGNTVGGRKHIERLLTPG